MGCFLTTCATIQLLSCCARRTCHGKNAVRLRHLFAEITLCIDADETTSIFVKDRKSLCKLLLKEHILPTVNTQEEGGRERDTEPESLEKSVQNSILLALRHNLEKVCKRDGPVPQITPIEASEPASPKPRRAGLSAARSRISCISTFGPFHAPCKHAQHSLIRERMPARSHQDPELRLELQSGKDGASRSKLNCTNTTQHH